MHLRQRSPRVKRRLSKIGNYAFKFKKRLVKFLILARVRVSRVIIDRLFKAFVWDIVVRGELFDRVKNLNDVFVDAAINVCLRRALRADAIADNYRVSEAAVRVFVYL